MQVSKGSSSLFVILLLFLLISFLSFIYYINTNQAISQESGSDNYLDTQENKTQETVEIPLDLTHGNVIDYNFESPLPIISIDILPINPDFEPGTQDFYLNKDTSTIEYVIDSEAAYYVCYTDEDGQTNLGPSNNETVADVKTNIENFVNALESNRGNTFRFSIQENQILNIYERCLP